jgi:hypothetical protein
LKLLCPYRYRIFTEESVKALNTIEVVFYKSEAVLLAWRAFNEEANRIPFNEQAFGDKHIRLLEEMGKAIGYRKIKWNNIKNYYYPVGLSSQIKDAETLQKTQIRIALKSLESEGEQNISEKI